jgi:sugar/nucleoside kinase (ribokinase family)
LDVLHQGLVGGAAESVTLRWGGVMSNMACVLGVLGADPLLMSVAYSGEMRWAVADHLAANGVSWLMLPATESLPLFHARVMADGSLADESFLGEHALTMLDPELLGPFREILANASVVVTCTDLQLAALSWLRAVTSANQVPLWLLCSGETEAHKLNINANRPDCVSMNLAELTRRTGAAPSSPADVLEAVQEIVRPGGRCLVTMGADGALLIDVESRTVHHQPAIKVHNNAISVGAGDVLYGCLLADRLTGVDWVPAIRRATERTSRYLARRGPHTERPYLSLLGGESSEIVQAPVGRVCSLDENLPKDYR